jgi:hypothetical protein
MRTEAKTEYKAFVQHQEVQKLRPKLTNCDPRTVFLAVRRYLENPSDLDQDRKVREQIFRKGIRDGARAGDLKPEESAQFHEKADEAFSTKKMGVAHCTESLVSLNAYIERKTGRALSTADLGRLVEALSQVQGRTYDLQPEALQKEIRRFKVRNPDYMKVLETDFTL